MDPQRLQQALAIATQAALDAGELLRAEFFRPEGPRRQGASALIDREIDQLLAARLRNALPNTSYVSEENPAARAWTGTNSSCWFVDPHDGTAAFLRGFRGTTISIGLVENDVPILGVVYAPCSIDGSSLLVTWAEGQPLRRNGQEITSEALLTSASADTVIAMSQDADRAANVNSALLHPARYLAVPSIAFRLALVALRQADAAISLAGPACWDVAAGHALVRAVGGTLLDAQGNPWSYRKNTVSNAFAGAPDLARALSRLPLERVFDDHIEAENSLTEWNLSLPLPLEHEHDGDVLARAQGVLFGQCIGDALGAQVEFRSREFISQVFPQGVRTLSDGGTWNTLAGQPTDDSELALLLAATLVRNQRFDHRALRKAFGAWLFSRPFDVGTTTRAGILGTPLLQSEANGALMRISPLGIFGARWSTEQLFDAARLEASITHPNAVCQDASALFAALIAEAIRSRMTPRELFLRAEVLVNTYRLSPVVGHCIEAARKGPPENFQEHAGWVATALRNALHHLYAETPLEEALVQTASAGGDTDTNAAIVGALLGAVHGVSAIPLQWIRAVETCRPIAALSGVHRPRPRAVWPVQVRALAEALLCLGSRFATNHQEKT